ncbi:MAG TPA: DUF2087 domain-containing protein [Actinocrinis sp.]|jgi:hypothetical protein
MTIQSSSLRGSASERARGSVRPDPRRLIAVLADPVRLRVFAALVLATKGADGEGGEGAETARIAEEAGVGERAAAKALGALASAGLARSGRDGWVATAQTLRAASEAAAKQRRDERLPAWPVVDEAITAPLRGYFEDGRLIVIPAQSGKRDLLLDYLAQCFEPGVRYSEGEVNEAISAFHDDYATLRRYLVDAGLLSRDQGFYWRSGGSFQG